MHDGAAVGEQVGIVPSKSDAEGTSCDFEEGTVSVDRVH